MTDMLTRGEVMETQNLTLNALQTPFNPNVIEQVRRFGFEYEMLTIDHRDGGDDEYESVDSHMEDYDEWSSDHDPCNCEDCRSERRSDERDRYLREWQEARANRSGGDSDVDNLIQRAYEAELISTTEQHDYHCRCNICSHHRSHPLLTAQTDCSCGVEFVSRILDFNTPTWMEEVDTWINVMQAWKNDGMWMPNGIESCGNHVHVSSKGDVDEWSDTVRRSAQQHINAMYAVFNWNTVADGGCGGRIRGYNRKPSPGDGGGWLSDRGYGTFEHRLWNTPRDPERLWGHIGISIGITRWAFAIAAADPTFSFYGSTGGYRYGGSITDETFKTVTANIGEVVRGIRSYIPRERQFDIARDLILNLSLV